MTNEKILTKEEASELAKQIFGKETCCYVGSLDDMWQHVKGIHKTTHTIVIKRLDKSQVSEDRDTAILGKFIAKKDFHADCFLGIKKGDIIKSAWYVCLVPNFIESHTGEKQSVKS